MGPISIAALAILAVIVLWVIVAYNGLVRQRNFVREGWSGIDIQLKRRHDLIPNLVETVEGYADFERSVLNDVTEKRTRAMRDESVADKQRDENALSGALRTLFAVAENYPDLKASGNFADLQRQLAEIEDVLQKARRYYNATVRDFNTRVESFPSNVIASLFGFQLAEFFEIDDRERAVPSVEFGQGSTE